MKEALGDLQTSFQSAWDSHGMLAVVKRIRELGKGSARKRAQARKPVIKESHFKEDSA